MTERRCYLQRKGKAFTRPQTCWNLGLGLPSPLNHEKINVCCLSHQVYDIVLWQPELTNTGDPSLEPLEGTLLATLDFGLLASRTVREKILVDLSHPVCGDLLQQP